MRSSAVRHFVWGPDIAGQQSASLDSGAEGVGGLLLIREWKLGIGLKQYLPLTDGLGNICGLLDATDGSLVAEFDYDPYGNPVIESLTHSRTNELTNFSTCPFRHRTRYYDSESWLYYYGYRYYDPSTTKWISKDPLGEEGGWNLTCFCNNDPVNGFDPTGLAIYGFGGTGNENDADITDGFSIVEQLVRASVKSANGEAYYMPGVFSGYTPKGKKNGFFSALTMPGQGARGWTLGKRVDFMIQALEWEFANTGDKEVNVLGFSRGSTAALEFLNRIAERAKKNPNLYKGMKINFVGLWDTVKTTTKDYRTDLPAGLVFEHRPLHFIAIDEYRGDFIDKDVLNVEGSLQIGFRGVHADIANGYTNSPFGWQSMKTAVFAAGLVGLKFNERVMEQYEGPKDWGAKPTDNDRWFYLGVGPRTAV